MRTCDTHKKYSKERYKKWIKNALSTHLFQLYYSAHTWLSYCCRYCFVLYRIVKRLCIVVYMFVFTPQNWRVLVWLKYFCACFHVNRQCDHIMKFWYTLHMTLYVPQFEVTYLPTYIHAYRLQSTWKTTKLKFKLFQFPCRNFHGIEC